MKSNDLLGLKLTFDPSSDLVINVVFGVVVAALLGGAVWRAKVSLRPARVDPPVRKPPAPRPPARAPDPIKKQKEEALRSLVGRVCVYKENDFIRLVTVADVKVTDWGADLGFDIVPAPGFAPGQERFGASASWDALSANGPFLFAQHVGWMLVVGSDLVNEIKSAAGEIAAGGEDAGEMGLLLTKRVNQLIRQPPKPALDIDAAFSAFKEKLGAGIDALEQHRYSEAESMLADAVKQAEVFPIAAPLDVALSALAKVHETQGHHTEAEPLLRRLLDIRETRDPEENADVSNVLNRLGLTLRWQKRYAEAEPFYRRALETLEAAPAPDDSESALVLNNLAGVVASLNRPAEAEALFLRAVQLLETAGGPDNPNIGGVLRGLGGVYLMQDRHAEARPVYLRSLEIEERVLGPDHPNLAHTLNNLSGIYMTLGSPADAIDVLRRAIAIREKALGPDHVLVAIAAQNLATFLAPQGEQQEVERLYIRSAAIFEKNLGPQSEELAHCLEQYAAFLTKANSPNAHEVAARAMSIRRGM